MAEYYTKESIRDQILAKNGKVDPDSRDGGISLSQNWLPALCETKTRYICGRTNACTVGVPIFFNTKRYIIEIFYMFSEDGCKGLIRASDMALNQLIADGIVDYSKLQKFSV